jgi:hypothetical protein
MKDNKENNKPSIETKGDTSFNHTAPIFEEKRLQSQRKNKLWILFLLFLSSLFLIGLLYFGLQFQQINAKYERLQMEYLSNMQEISNVNDLKKVLVALENEIDLLRKENEYLMESSDRTDGIFFEVQLGAFKDFNLDQYLKNLSAIRQEKYDDKTKIVLGKFRSFNRALLFENDMKRMGFNEAFIVGRVNGKVVPYQEALEMLKLDVTK